MNNNFAQPTKAPSVNEEHRWGKIQVYTGHGKGKTTAALGLAIRALGHGQKVVLVYFDKGGANYGERKILDRLKGKTLKYYVTGQPRFNAADQTFRFGVETGDRQEALRGLEIVEELFLKNQADLLILDEINSTIALGMLPLAKFLAVLDKKPAQMEVVLTGRDVHDKIIERADLVTEMKLVKHYFYQGQKAREGIEY